MSNTNCKQLPCALENADIQNDAISTFEEHFDEILCDAFYGSDWAYIVIPESFRTVTGDVREDKWKMILNNGGYLILIDDDTDASYKLTKQALQKAWCKLYDEYRSSYNRMLDGTYDYIDADNIIQLAVFGDIVYG